jgi:hypothetical protein
MTSMYNPAHPGLLLRDYLGELSITTVAERPGVTRAALSRILNGHGYLAWRRARNVGRNVDHHAGSLRSVAGTTETASKGEAVPRTGAGSLTKVPHPNRPGGGFF